MEQSNENIKQEYTKVDFSKTILGLENRARKARRKVTFVFIFLFGVVFIFAYLILVTQMNVREISYKSLMIESRERDYSVERPFLRRLNQLTDSLIGPDNNYSEEVRFVEPHPSKASILKAEIKETLELYKIAHDINRKEANVNDTSSEVANAISTGVFSLGAVGFIVLLIQIAIMFMRYYSQLAELYEAQSEALKASDGNPELAYKFMENFTPTAINLGQSPSSLYEKALDTVKEVARKNQI